MKNKTNGKFKAILFDKDGVLIDSLDAEFAAVNKTREHYGISNLSKDEFLKKCWGTKESKNNNTLGIVSEEELEEIAAYYRKIKTELKNNAKLFPNTLAVLKVLKRKYKIGLVTNSNKSVALRILNDFEIRKYFDVIVGGDETEPKPAPDPLLKAFAELNIKPQEALFIGDTDTDIRAGKAANCTLSIVTTSKTREELEAIGGIIIIDDLKEILEIV